MLDDNIFWLKHIILNYIELSTESLPMKSGTPEWNVRAIISNRKKTLVNVMTLLMSTKIKLATA